MTKSWCSLVIVAVLTASGCTTLSRPRGTNELLQIDLSASREVVLIVHGLSCPLCSNNLDGQLKNIAGVEAASIDLKTGAVTVRLAERHAVTAADLAEAVRNAGFTLKAIEAKKLDQ